MALLDFAPRPLPREKYEHLATLRDAQVGNLLKSLGWILGNNKPLNSMPPQIDPLERINADFVDPASIDSLPPRERAALASAAAAARRSRIDSDYIDPAAVAAAAAKRARIDADYVGISPREQLDADFVAPIPRIVQSASRPTITPVPAPKQAASKPKAAQKKQTRQASAATAPAQNPVVPQVIDPRERIDADFVDPAALTPENKYNALLKMYGIAPGQPSTFNPEAAQEHYANFGGGPTVYEALSRIYGWPQI